MVKFVLSIRIILTVIRSYLQLSLKTKDIETSELKSESNTILASFLEKEAKKTPYLHGNDDLFKASFIRTLESERMKTRNGSWTYPLFFHWSFLADDQIRTKDFEGQNKYPNRRRCISSVAGDCLEYSLRVFFCHFVQVSEYL